MKLKKILVINTTYREFGGEDSNILEEIKDLSTKFDVSYLEFKNSERLTYNEILSFALIANKNSNYLLTERLNSFNPDLVYVHNTWFKANLGIFKILEDKKIPTILKLHNFRYYCSKFFFHSSHLGKHQFCNMCGMKKEKFKIYNKYYENSFSKSLALFFYSKKLFKLLIKGSFKIAVLTDFHKNFLVNLGITNNKLITLRNPIRIEKNSYNPKISSGNLIYAGRLTKEKGLIQLINVWIKLFKKNNLGNLNLLIAGDGELKEYIKSLNNNYQISYLEHTDNENILDLIKKSLAVITPTRMFEGQPRLLCEASSLGVPSIYPSFGGMDEFFPKDYSLSFAQFDYEDLEKKIMMLENKDLLQHESKRVKKHLQGLLSNDKALINKIYDEFKREYEQ